jgi:ABC-2 type transport system permease protein
MAERPSPIVQLTLWRLREFLREPEALFWVFAFPIVLAFALGIAFKSRAPKPVQVGVAAGPGAEELARTLDASPQIAARVYPPVEAHNRLRSGRVLLVAVAGDPVVFEYDSTRQESAGARLVVNNALQEASGRHDVRAVQDQRITEPGARYIDFLLPGLLGMNIMGTGMWGVGFGIVKTRNQKLLKRLLASPMKKRHYLLSQMLARLVFLGLEVGSLLLFGHLMFDVPVRGSFLAITVVVVIGALSFAGLGLLVASRTKTIEGVSGLMNLVMVPMWIGSGVFFSYANFPQSVQPFLRALPLTQLNDALRGVLIDGASLAHVSPLVLALAAWTALTFGVALKIFRWQ